MRRAPGAVLLVAVVLAGCGGGEGTESGELRWVGQPRVYRSPTLPRDRVLQGVVRNDSLRKVVMKAGSLKLRDASGGEIATNTIFASGYSHRLAPLDRRGEVEPERLQVRRGLRLSLEPGKTAPVTVSWRVADGARAVRLDYGGGSLPLP